MAHPVRYLHSEMVGAPELFGPGTMIELLDACLINGFNLIALDSLTYDSGANEVTGTLSTGHGFDVGAVIRIGGADQAAYNGDHMVTAADATTFTYTPASAPSGAATGTLGARIAQLDGGWTKPFSGANLAAYQSGEPDATGMYLRVDDTDDFNAQVRGYESMADIDTPSGPFPLLNDYSEADYIWRRIDTTTDPSDGTAPWVLIGDGRFFYLFVAWHVGSSSYGPHHATYLFGDFPSYLADDEFNCLINAHYESDPFSPGADNGWGILTNPDGKRLAGSYDQLTLAPAFATSGSAITNNQGISDFSYPDPISGGLHLHYPVLVHNGENQTASETHPIRGYLPGAFQVVQNLPLSHKQILENVAGAIEKKVLLIATAVDFSESRSAFDITGPWR